MHCPDLLEPIKNLETGCKNFDNIQYPWKYRTDFSKLGSNSENIILKKIDRIKEALDDRQNLIQQSSIDNQKLLLKSVQELDSILDMFLNIEYGNINFDAQEYPWVCNYRQLGKVL